MARSTVVLTGTVISTHNIAVETNSSSKWELWRAEVKVHSISKQDTNLTERVFIYYHQDHAEYDGTRYTRYTQACPGRPRIAGGDTKKFYCRRQDAGDAKSVLFISQGGYVTPP